MLNFFLDRIGKRHYNCICNWQVPIIDFVLTDLLMGYLQVCFIGFSPTCTVVYILPCKFFQKGKALQKVQHFLEESGLRKGFPQCGQMPEANVSRLALTPLNGVVSSITAPQLSQEVMYCFLPSMYLVSNIH